MSKLPTINAQLIFDSIDIETARMLGTEIHEIRSYFVDQDALKLLRASLYKWAKDSDLELDEQTEVSRYSYGGPSYNGRTKYGRESEETKVFSTFKVTINSDGG